MAERLYILPSDKMAERWTGRRLTGYEAEALSGVRDIRRTDLFAGDIHALATAGRFANVYLDLYRCSPSDLDRPSHVFLRKLQTEYPFLAVKNANALIRRLRTIKEPCEIEALCQLEALLETL